MIEVFYLNDSSGRCVAAGSWEAIYAAARLIFNNTEPRLVKVFENSVMQETVKLEMNHELMNNFTSLMNENMNEPA